jgi:hypothetical protein
MQGVQPNNIQQYNQFLQMHPNLFQCEQLARCRSAAACLPICEAVDLADTPDLALGHAQMPAPPSLTP